MRGGLHLLRILGKAMSLQHHRQAAGLPEGPPPHGLQKDQRDDELTRIEKGEE